MSSQTPIGIHWADAMDPLETRRRARVVASFAEYLAEHDDHDRDRAIAGIAALVEWSEGDPELLAQARAEVRGDTRRAQRRAHRVDQNNRYAAQLLEQAGRAR